MNLKQRIQIRSVTMTCRGEWHRISGREGSTERKQHGLYMAEKDEQQSEPAKHKKCGWKKTMKEGLTGLVMKNLIYVTSKNLHLILRRLGKAVKGF